MTSLRRRIARAEARAPMVVAGPEETATARWLRYLKIFQVAFQRSPASGETTVILDRIQRSVTMLDAFESPPLNATPHPYLEDFCHACLLRLRWNGDWIGRELAFCEADYDTHMAEIERIEKRCLTKEPHSDPR